MASRNDPLMQRSRPAMSPNSRGSAIRPSEVETDGSGTPGGH